MQKQNIQLPDMTLVGLTARTNNKSEMNPETSKIAELAGFYWGNQIADNILHRAKPSITYAVYTDFESDENGEYTYFIGEVVDSLQNQDLEKFKTISIPASHYQKFSTEPGKMPEVVISAWQAIWTMKESDFGGKRKYVADFEIYDERAADLNNAVIDIYIGIEEDTRLCMKKVNINEKLALFKDHWSPKIVGDLNDSHIKLAKFKGEFVWHKHDNEDELFFIIKGHLLIKLRDRDIHLKEGEFVIIPKGVEHLPIAEEEVWVMLIEPKNTLNTGDAESDLKKEKLDRI